VRKPAEFLRSQLRLRLAVFAATVVVAAILALAGAWWWPASFMALLVLFILQRQATQGRALSPSRLRKGILGEQAVAEALSGLPSTYWVVHGVATGHGDVDHVVIGPTGVFAIETKAWDGTFYRNKGQLYCNGQPAEHVLRQARGAAGNVRQMLLDAGVDEWVDAVVVAARATVTRSPLRFRQAFVVSIDDIVDFVTGRRRALSTSTVLRATASLVEPGDVAPPTDAGGASSTS
jgi:hypothetical protein